MITLGVLYFFSRAMAQDSPILLFFTKYSSIAFGNIGLLFFFGLCIFTGILILAKGHLAKFLMKYFFSLLMFVSAFLNVRIWNAPMPMSQIPWAENGGFFSRPLIRLLERGLGAQNTTAIKAVIITLLLILIGYLLYVFNVRLPKLPKINIETPEAPNKKEKKSDSKEQERPTITITRPEISTAEIMEKVSQATGKITSSSLGS